MRTAVYPGSFDPITMGHINIIERSLKLFDKVIVAVLQNPDKKPLFSTQERVELIKTSFKGYDNVEVHTFTGLLVKFMEQKKIGVIVKGLRAISDFDFEFSMALMNHKLNPEIETVFLMTEDKYAFLSSSKVKEIYTLGGSAPGLVSPYVEEKLMEKILLTGHLIK